MITINGPFILALTIIIYLVVIKWIEWYLFRNGTFHLKKKSNSGTPVNASVKRLFFFGKADLRRPWYVGLPIAVFIILQHTIINKGQFEIIQIVCFYTVGLLFTTLTDIYLMLRANKDFFSIDGRRARYLKTQLAQALLACIVVAVIIGAMLIDAEKKYADPPGLRESVNWVIDPIFEADWPIFTEGLVPVRKDDRYGFVDKEGNLVIPFRYEEGYNFYEGLAAVRKDKKWGYIDKQGRQIIPFLYDEAFDFGDGLAPVKKGDQWMVIDKKGTVQFKTDYQYIYPFHEGVAMVEVRDKEHRSLTYNNLIDREGHLLFQKHYSFDNNYNEGCLPVFDNKAGKSYYIDINEKKVIPYDYVEAGKFSDGYAAVWLKNEGYALIDHTGNILKRLSEEEYYDYPFYNEGLVGYNTGKWNGSGDDLYREGFKDRYGNIIIPADFQSTAWSGEGLIGLKVDGLWGFVKNPLPQAAWVVDSTLWQEDRTQIASVEGLPVYAGELESAAYNIKEVNPKLTGIPAYKKAFEQLKAEKAFEKYGKTIDLDKIQYQIGNTYYRLLLLEKN